MSKGFQRNTKEQLAHTKSQTDLLMEGLVQNSYAIQHLQQQLDQVYGLLRLSEKSKVEAGDQVLIDAAVYAVNEDGSTGALMPEAELKSFQVDTTKAAGYPEGFVAGILGMEKGMFVRLKSKMPENHPNHPGAELLFSIEVVKVLA